MRNAAEQTSQYHRGKNKQRHPVFVQQNASLRLRFALYAGDGAKTKIPRSATNKIRQLSQNHCLICLPETLSMQPRADFTVCDALLFQSPATYLNRSKSSSRSAIRSLTSSRPICSRIKQPVCYCLLNNRSSAEKMISPLQDATYKPCASDH